MDRLTEQREYYRKRAGEYDQWWQARGQHAKSAEDERRWFADIAEVERALEQFSPAGDVLELAAGTGWWTQRLTQHASSVTAVDAAEETLTLNRRRTQASGKVTYLVADLFDWSPPPRAFDAVFFSYWLSHVPDEKLAAFWASVAAALRPGGRVFLLDSYRHQRIPDDVQQRFLNDGRRFEVFKRYWQPDELAATPGWHLTPTVTQNQHIIYAYGSRRGDH